MAMCHDGQAMGYFYPTLYKNNNFYVFLPLRHLSLSLSLDDC